MITLGSVCVWKKVKSCLRCPVRRCCQDDLTEQERQADKSALDRALRQSTTAVDVVLQSDNLTDVTLFRIAKLGLFAQTTVQLRPGRYIAAGSRMGYRDVRFEFTITGEPLAQPIQVRCSEQI